MSVIVLYHASTPIPQHLRDCVLKIRQRSSIPVHLLTDRDEPVDGVSTVDIRTAAFSSISSRCSPDYFHGDEMVTMWRGAVLRLFYIERFLRDTGIQNVLHFDNDVMLFADPEKILSICGRCYTDCAMTRSAWGWPTSRTPMLCCR